MKKISLDTWIQLVGMLSVVAGLIFVGIEMRQTQRVALAAQQQQRAATLIEIIGTFSEANSPLSWLDFVSEDFDVSEENSRALGENAAYQLWMIYENDYLQYELGLMDNEIWEAKLAAMRYLVSRCQFQDVNQAALTYSNAELTALLRVVNVEECSERP
tara:strand:- start:144 stop:620 length:477 start_codon:yes stop_codon:yes gene_type:complete